MLEFAANAPSDSVAFQTYWENVCYYNGQMVDGKRDGTGVLFDSKTKDLTYCYWRDDMPWSRVRVVCPDQSYILNSKYDSSVLV